MILLALLVALGAQGQPKPKVHVVPGADGASIDHLGVDTEGGDRHRHNLLRSKTAATIEERIQGKWQDGARDLRLDIAEANGGFDLSIRPRKAGQRLPDKIRLRFPLDPTMAATTVLPSRVNPDGTFSFPAILCAPDHGQLVVTGQLATSTLEGSRDQRTVDWTVELADDRRLSFQPVLLPPPQGLISTALWQDARRGWFNSFQVSARWGDPNAKGAPAGVLANNIISDPCSVNFWTYADAMVWTPQLAPGVSLAGLVAGSVDWWLTKRMLSTGEVIGYWDLANFLDANPSILIGAWDYVEATGDLEWLKQHLDALERAAGFLAGRDVDHDGLIEAVQSGNRGTLKSSGRSCSTYDAINCGHKDAYSNAVAYRAWKCLADLEKKLGRTAEAALYQGLAARLKEAYSKTFLNPRTGWIAWWKSADGEIHDLASPVINGLAVEYGLVEAGTGRIILDKLDQKMRGAGFGRFDLGVPITLVPVPKGDYIEGDSHGCPKREDGSDTFGTYLNGGCLIGDTLHYLQAHYVVGKPDRADQILRAMVRRQAAGAYPNGGGFQNGVHTDFPSGAEYTTWEGKTSGYEGHLTESYAFLQAVVLREAPFRDRLYRPLK